MRPTDAARLGVMLRDAELKQAFPAMLRAEAVRELNWQNVTTGIDDSAIEETIAQFLASVESAANDMISHKVAEGELPQTGADARLEYTLNESGLALRDMGEDERQGARRRIHEVHPGQALIVRHPPANAKPGITVRGERIEPKRSAADRSLAGRGGPNTHVEGDRITAAIDGIYREDARGNVRVVQELVVDEVNAATGDLPRVGVAAANILVRLNVAAGSAVQTSEDLFVGTPEKGGTVDGGTSIRARNLIVRGLVAGGILPEPFLSGEMEALEESEQDRMAADLERSQIHVEGIFAAREVTGRNINGASVYVQQHVHGSALEVDGDVRIDGDLVGGLVTCGGLVEVMGDMGNEAGTATRVRLSIEGAAEKRQRELAEAIQTARRVAHACTEELGAHRGEMEAKAAKSLYWASLLAGEKRPPAKPVERRLLVQYLKAAKQAKKLETSLFEAQEELRDLQRLLADNNQVEGDAEGEGVRIQVGGRVHPGVSMEIVRPLLPSDLDRTVLDRNGNEAWIADTRDELQLKLEHYLSLYESGVQEREKALKKIYAGMDSRPEASIPDRRFSSVLHFAQAPGSNSLSKRGQLYVHAHDPDTFYLVESSVVARDIDKTSISIEVSDGRAQFSSDAGEADASLWQENDEILESLEEIWVSGKTARQHLLEE